MIYNRGAGAQVLGCLLKDPEILSNTDKYLLTLDDFAERLPRMIFGHLYNLYHDGMKIIDIPAFTKEISKYPEQSKFFEDNNGEQFMAAAMEKAEQPNFDFYYDRLKKISLIRELSMGGFDISEWYAEGLYDIKLREELEYKLEQATVHEIIESVQEKVLDIESKFINKATFKVSKASEGLEEVLKKLSQETAIGLPLNGSSLSTIVLGARRGKVFSLSGDSGAGKSRYAISNACKLAYPILWNHKKGKWDNIGSNQKVMLVTTELSDDEVQTFMLSCVSGVPEDRLLESRMSDSEKKRIEEAMAIMTHYEDNFLIYQLPDPNVSQVKVNLRKYCIRYQLDAVFYDYIHTSPSLLTEFSGARIREDVALMLLSTALKEIANEQDIFIWTGTQLNGTLEPGTIGDVTNIRGL